MGWIKTTVVNILLLVAFLAVLDGVCWLLPLHYKILPPHEPKGYLKFDPQLGYDIAPNQATSSLTFADSSFDIWSNSIGCFDTEYSNTDPYIYVTGDSFTWGWAPFEDKWGTQIQTLTGIRVLKCGVDGYGTRQELIKTTRHLSALPSPAMIIVGYFGSNDVDDDVLFPNHIVYGGYSIHSTQTCPDATCTVQEIPRSLKLDAKAWLATHSVLYTLFQRDVYAPLLAHVRGAASTEVGEQEMQVLPAVHTDAMLGFQALADKISAKLLVVLIPNKADVRGSGSYSNERMKAFLDLHGIDYVDLLPAFKAAEQIPEHPLYWSFDGHWNVEGNILAGKTVADYIATKGK